MFLNIDIHEQEHIAMTDNQGIDLSYGELCDFCSSWGERIVSRSVILILCENKVGALAGYVASIENKVVPILVGASVDKELLEHLMNAYRPAYLWLPSGYELKISHTEIFSKYGFSLIRTENKLYPISDELSLLLPTSGSTGSPKLVRYKYGNLEANAKNVATVFGWTEEERPICDLPIHYTMGLNVINSSFPPYKSI